MALTITLPWVLLSIASLTRRNRCAVAYQREPATLIRSNSSWVQLRENILSVELPNSYLEIDAVFMHIHFEQRKKTLAHRCALREYRDNRLALVRGNLSS